MNEWEKLLGIKYPTCQQTGNCCTMVSPSAPPLTLLEKAAKGDSYSREFLSLFLPYKTTQEAVSINSDFVEKALNLASKSSFFKGLDDVYFYSCIYYQNNKCQVYEDRPQLCRDYPDTPFLLMHPNCAFNPWAKECKKLLNEKSEQLSILKDLHESLIGLTDLPSPDLLVRRYNTFLVSPKFSWLK